MVQRIKLCGALTGAAQLQAGVGVMLGRNNAGKRAHVMHMRLEEPTSIGFLLRCDWVRERQQEVGLLPGWRRRRSGWPASGERRQTEGPGCDRDNALAIDQNPWTSPKIAV
jgi:hypothetical protein